jgi:hypothetical protein
MRNGPASIGDTPAVFFAPEPPLVTSTNTDGFSAAAADFSEADFSDAGTAAVAAFFIATGRTSRAARPEDDADEEDDGAEDESEVDDSVAEGAVESIMPKSFGIAAGAEWREKRRVRIKNILENKVKVNMIWNKCTVGWAK